MAINGDSSPFLFPSTDPASYPSDSAPQSLSTLPSFGSSSSSNSPHNKSSSSHFPAAAFGPCAACKFRSRPCLENCCLALFFTPDEVHKFAVVDSVFGSGNVVNFLQQSSNSSYTSLLLLFRDITQEDGSDPKKNTLSETDIHNHNSDQVRELSQGRELAKQLQVHLSSESSDVIRDHLVQRILSSFDKSLAILNLSGSISQLRNDVGPAVAATNNDPIFMEDSLGSVNLDAIHNAAAKERKTLPRWTDHVRVTSEDGLEEPVDDGYCWIKYGQKDVFGAKYPRSYYRCFYRNTQNCLAKKQMQRSNKDPTIFDVVLRGVHTCSHGQQSVPPPALQGNAISGQYSALDDEPDISLQPLELDLSL